MPWPGRRACKGAKAHRPMCGAAHLAVVADEHEAGLGVDGGVLAEPAQLLGRQLLVQRCTGRGRGGAGQGGRGKEVTSPRPISTCRPQEGCSVVWRRGGHCQLAAAGPPQPPAGPAGPRPPATAVLLSSGGASAGNQVTTPSHCSSAFGPAGSPRITPPLSVARAVPTRQLWLARASAPRLQSHGWSRASPSGPGAPQGPGNP